MERPPTLATPDRGLLADGAAGGAHPLPVANAETAWSPVPRVRERRQVEWPTVGLTALCYLAWGTITLLAAQTGPWLAAILLAPVVALHSSLQHETLHGHPFPSRSLSDATVFPALGLFIPYERFRDTHLAHHRDEHLTDPYDDPESNYLDPSVWTGLARPVRVLLAFNNTLAGRMILGPLLGLAVFWRREMRLVARGERAVIRGWAMHLLGLVPVALWLSAAAMPLPAYLLGAYLGLSILKVRTFLEHRAHEKVAGRSVIVEDRGPLALLFLNNNYHAVHHAHPKVAWYRLPAFYRARRDVFLARNRGYRYASYAEVFRHHLLKPKDPVPHPLRGRE